MKSSELRSFFTVEDSNSFHTFSRRAEIFHDIQYNAIVWMFQRKRVVTGNCVSSIEKFIFSPGILRIIIYLLLIAAYGYIGVVTSYADINLPEKMLTGGTGSSWILRILSVSAFLHFYYDGFIWRIRNSNTREGLGIERSNTLVIKPNEKKISQSVAGFLPRGQWRHGLLWFFFTASVSLLGFSEYKYGTPEPQKMFLNLTENIPSSWLAQFLTTTYYKIAGDSKIAADHFKMAALNNPNFDMAHMLWADMLYKNGSVSEAIEQYQITVKLEPSNNEARNNLAYLYLQTDQPVLAETEFKKAMELDNQSVDLVFGLAVALFNQKKYAETEKYLHQTLQLSPNHTQAQKFIDQIHVYLR